MEKLIIANILDVEYIVYEKKSADLDEKRISDWKRWKTR